MQENLIVNANEAIGAGKSDFPVLNLPHCNIFDIHTIGYPI